ncbi:PD40 domain-containing protein [Paenibacillus sp. 19GGS1-52]|uniref:hypothetical protein n=1 Tax=Paenibacillus sp. 19GGS1-52 TaxID=2758563 RepID=UPI001EFBDF4C|nr:hypothetical protein [Paenibacillus sp. 19GGS1-52]ULO07328.1 PD40 domain-containing protein [Paenibacillus sp. 19GGS1-52]
MQKIINSKLGTTVLILLSTLSLLSIAACGTGETEARKIIEQSGKKITVMDNTTESVYTKLKLTSIDKLEGVRGMDWVSEDMLVVDKENKEQTPVTVEGQQRYPHNFYLRDLASGKETPLKEGEKSLGFALLSPDKKHVFYKEVYEATGIGYIMDMETGVSVKTGDAEFMTTEGEWADNEHVIFPNMEGNIVRVDVSGNSEIAVKTGVGYVHNVVQAGSIIYYIAHEDSQLIAYDTETKQSVVLTKEVMWAIPSPDGAKLALVKRTAPTEMTLFLCDTAGNELSTLASGTQVFGTSWSPDGSKIAYTTTSENGNENGLFITEVETGEQTPISNDMQASDKLRWSPSGKKLLTSTSVLKDNAYQFMAYVITLS